MTAHYTSNGVPLIRNSDIKDSRFEFKEKIYLDNEFALVNKSRCHQLGDIVTVHTGDIGTSAIIDENLVGSIGFATIVTRITDKMVNNEFIKSYYNSPQYKQWAINQATGDGRNNLNMKDFNKKSIYIPCLSEQTKIAKFIRLLNEKIVKQQQLVELLKKYKRGLISVCLNGKNDDKKIKIGDFCEVQMCKRIFRNETTQTGEIPFYKIGTLGSKPDAFISRKLFEEYKQKYNYPKKGEFLISCSGTVGRCVLYDGEDSYYQDSNIVWLRNMSDYVHNEYLYYLISNVDWSILNSTTITRIYSDNLRELEFNFPQIEEQKKVANNLAILDRKINSYSSNLELLRKQKRGLLQQLFI